MAVVALLITFAGCSGLGESSPGTTTDAGTTSQTPTTAATESGATTDSAGTTAPNGSAETTAANDTAGTTAANDSSGTTAADGHSHSHGHSHGDETSTDSESDESNESNESANTSDPNDYTGSANDSESNGSTGSTNDSETNGSAQLSGKMTVVVAGNELPLDDLATGDRVSIASDDEHTWRASSELALAEALASFGVDASADSLSYNGTTYREATNGTTVSVRVDGEPVDPESYTLQDGDQVWVTVETAETDYSVPGTYIRAAQQHIHGQMEFVVDGETVDFSRPRFQSGHRHFHFEGGHADPWHAHSWSVTLQYGLNTLSGINVTEDAVTYNGTTYTRGAANETVSITVNGDPVDPSEYLLKDGDDVRIVVERDGS